MAFKFDDNDDDLSLDLGKDSPKTQKPAPLPKVEPKKDVLGGLPKPGQSTPPKNKPAAPKIPSQPSVPAVEKPSISAPAPKAVAKPSRVEPVALPEFDSSEIDDMYEEGNIPTYEESLETNESTSIREPQPQLKTQASVGRRTRGRTSYVENNQFVPPSDNILTHEEAARTIKKTSPFDGDRKRVAQVRVIATIVAIFLMGAGIYSFIPKPGFKDDLSQINAAITFSNKYEAVKTASENYALRFTTDFLNRTEVTESTRQTTMETYMNAKTISLVNFNLSKIPVANNNNGINVYMRPIGGPYVYGVNNIDASKIQAQRISEGDGFIYSIQTATYVQPYISSNDIKSFGSGEVPTFEPKWVYLSIPVMHNYVTKQTTLYGFPSFFTPEKTAGLESFLTPFDTAEWPQEDKELSGNTVLIAQLEAFLTEWAKQSPNDKTAPSLQSLLAQDATERTKVGLAGAYTSVTGQKIIADVNVKPMDKDQKPTASTNRTALVTVKWTDANELNAASKYVPAVYTQQYMIEFRGAGDKWQIIDIKARFAE